MSIKLWITGMILATYSLLFIFGNASGLIKKEQLSPVMPLSFYQIIAPYLRQLSAESLYIQTMVFIGDVDSTIMQRPYEKSLSAHFFTIQKLHPPLIDTYYSAQGFLPWLSREGTLSANAIHEEGMKVLPTNWRIPFYAGFNHFYFLNDPEGAAPLLRKSFETGNSPRLVGHLASMLAARGSDLVVSLVWIKSMLEREQDETIRQRYIKDVDMLERSLAVQAAIRNYYQKHGALPTRLDALIPDFIAEIPVFAQGYRLNYSDGRLSLIRPDKHSN